MRRRFFPQLFSALLMAAFVVPDYPNAKKIFESQPTVNGMRMKLTAYNTADSPQQVVDFYKNALQDEFKVLMEYQEPKAVYFVDKEGHALNLVCLNNPFDNSTSIQLSYNLDPSVALDLAKGEPEEKKQAEIEKDVPGEDVFWLRRYPGSIRTVHLQEGNSVTVVYTANTDCLKCLLDYYRQELSIWGWRLLREEKTRFNPDKRLPEGLSKDIAKKLDEGLKNVSLDKELLQDNYLLLFEKEKGRCAIIINLAGNRARALIQYTAIK